MRRLAAFVLTAVVTACGGDVPDQVTEVAPPATAVATPTGEQRFPDVLTADIVRDDARSWTVSATISSPYDTTERYADAFRVLTPDGRELGVRVLTHPHQDEQPFTRSLSGVEIPVDVQTVVVQGRDLVHGWGGTTFTIVLPDREW